jgi:hypothetical protein
MVGMRLSAKASSSGIRHLEVQPNHIIEKITKNHYKSEGYYPETKN